MKRLVFLLLALLPFTAGAASVTYGVASNPAAIGPAAITSGTITGITDLAVADGGTGASTAQGALQNLRTTYFVCQGAVAASVGATTSETDLVTCAIPANSMGPNGLIAITGRFTITNSANSKTFRLKFGGTTFETAVITTQDIGAASITLYNRNLTNSQVGSSASTGSGSAGAYVTGAVDTTSAQNAVISCQKASSGETCTLEVYTITVFYGSFLTLDRFAPEELRTTVAANDAHYAYADAA